MRLKVVINAASAKMGGALTYITNVLRHLPPPESGHEFEVFLPPEAAKKQAGLARNVRLLITNIGHAGWLKRLWWEQITLRSHLRRIGADVLFSTGNFAMFRCPVRQLVLVCNALYFSKLYRGELTPRHTLRMKVAFMLRRWLICRSVESCDVVMTPSQAMLDELRRAVEVNPRKTLVNPYGVAEEDLPSQPTEGPISAPRAESSSIVRLLYVSLYSEHKNLRTLLKALPLLNGNGGRKFLLKTTANPAWEGAAWTLTHQEDIALARRQDTAPWVAFVGPLGLEETQGLYRSADVFVFPSLTESFGHPMVEAMAHGLPIVASDTPVNREICGEAAVYFSPLRPQDLARQIQLLVSDVSLWKQLSRATVERARTRFAWSPHVERLLDAAEHPLNGIREL